MDVMVAVKSASGISPTEGLLVKAALLYADRVTLASVNAAFSAGIAGGGPAKHVDYIFERAGMSDLVRAFDAGVLDIHPLGGGEVPYQQVWAYVT